jgi:ABC-type branched-subunit amino acid transport system permease subunit
MRSGVAILTVVAFASVPLWLRDPYLMNALITTGIFIVGAMSLNLLLGFTGQLSLGHIAFFGIGAYVSAWFRRRLAVRLPHRSRTLAADSRFCIGNRRRWTVRISRGAAVVSSARRVFRDRDDFLR